MKKQKQIISAMLIAVFLISAISVPVSAASWKWTNETTFDRGNSYTVKRASAPITVDGKVSAGEDWNYAADSRAFDAAYVGNSADGLPTNDQNCAPSFKALWYSDGSDAYLYILLSVDDKTIASVGATAWNGDVYTVQLDEDGDGKKELALPAMYIGGREISESASVGASRFTCKSDDRRTADGTGDGYTVEMQYKFKNAADCSGTVLLDIFVQDYLETVKSYARYSWNGIYDTGNTPLGKLTISSDLANTTLADLNDDALFYNGETAVASQKKDSDGNVTLPEKASGRTVAGWATTDGTGKLYAPGSKVAVGSTQLKLKAVFAAPVTQNGASVLIAAESKLRFEAVIPQFSEIQTYITESGFIFVELSKLNGEILTDVAFTAEELTNANIEFQNVKSETVAEKIYGSFNAKDTDTKYAAVSYVKVKYSDGTELYIYSEFSVENHSRNICEVAVAAYNDRTSVKNSEYSFKQGKEYGVEDFEILSYSPYANVQLNVLKALGKIS